MGQVLKSPGEFSRAGGIQVLDILPKPLEFLPVQDVGHDDEAISFKRGFPILIPKQGVKFVPHRFRVGGGPSRCKKLPVVEGLPTVLAC